MLKSKASMTVEAGNLRSSCKVREGSGLEWVEVAGPVWAFWRL